MHRVIPPPRCQYQLATLGYRTLPSEFPLNATLSVYGRWDHKHWGHPSCADLDEALHEWAERVDSSKPWVFMRCLDLFDPQEAGVNLRPRLGHFSISASSMDATKMDTNGWRHCPQSFWSIMLLAILELNLEVLLLCALQCRFYYKK